MARYTTTTAKVVIISHRFAGMRRCNYWIATDFRCTYCGKELLLLHEDGTYRPDLDDMTLDHVIPRSEGGGSTEENLVACCNRCNSKKGNSPLEIFRMRLFNAAQGFTDKRFAYEREDWPSKRNFVWCGGDKRRKKDERRSQTTHQQHGS